MNWSKAKNILIIAFIITNLILVITLNKIDKDNNKYASVDKEFVQDVKNLLLDKNIKLSTEIPIDTPPMSLLTIEYEVYDTQEKQNKLARHFLGEYTKIHDNNNEVVFKKDDEELIIKNNRHIIYMDKNKNKKYDELNYERVNSIIINFLKEKGLYKEDFKLTNYYVENNIHKLEFSKIHKNMFIEKSYMKFDIDNTGIKEFQRVWIEPIGLKDVEISVRPAPDALLRLLSRQEAYGKTIIDISLCYYFDPSANSTGDLKNTKQGDAVPAWRIEFRDGMKIFLTEY